MAKATKENEFVRRATRLGLLQMKRDLDAVLESEMPEAQRIAIEEMHSQILSLLEEYK